MWRAPTAKFKERVVAASLNSQPGSKQPLRTVRMSTILFLLCRAITLDPATGVGLKASPVSTEAYP